MFRLIANALRVTALLLAVATCALWVRSYWTSDWVTWSRSPHQYRLRTIAGRIEAVVYDDYTAGSGWQYWTKSPPSEKDLLAHSTEHFRLAGFGYYTYNAGRKYAERTLVLPIWSIAALLALAGLLRPARRRPRTAHAASGSDSTD